MSLEFSVEKVVGTVNEKVIGTITVAKQLTESDIENIMVNAIEGVIGQWSLLHNNKPEWDDKPKGEPISTWAARLLLDGKEVIFSELGENKEISLTLPKLINGFQMNAIKRPWDSDIDNGDAITADCIIQYALFEELVYG